MRASGIFLIAYGVFSSLAFSSVSINFQESIVIVLGALFGTLLIYSGYLLLSGRRAGFAVGTFTCATLSGFYAYFMIFSLDWLGILARVADTLMLVGGIFGLAICLVEQRRHSISHGDSGSIQADSDDIRTGSGDTPA